MKTRHALTNLAIVAGLFFTLAFACGDEKLSEGAKGNKEATNLNQAESEDVRGPRLGEYDVLTYGNPKNPPIRQGHFELLSGGKYKFYDNGGTQKSQGQYRFDEDAQAVQWLSGIFKEDGWTGAFEITRDGKTHNIRLTRSTFGTNSTD